MAEGQADWPSGEQLVTRLWEALDAAGQGEAGIDGCRLVRLRLDESAFTWTAYDGNPERMVYLTRRFDFNAAHRLHNPDLSDEQNRTLYGKCNNPSGHGHNYLLEVTVTGRPRQDGILILLDDLRDIVNRRVVERLDHQHLDVDVPQFSEINSTVENIAVVIWEMLDGYIPAPAKLHGVRIWETPKTYSEYFGPVESAADKRG